MGRPIIYIFVDFKGFLIDGKNEKRLTEFLLT